MKSISDEIKYVIESIAFDYVDYKVDFIGTGISSYGRCYKIPEQNYGIIDLSDILKTYCNFQSIFVNENYLNANTMAVNSPILRFNLSTKTPNQQAYVLLISGEEILANYKNLIYDTIPTSDNVANKLQHKSHYYADRNARIPYDLIRKYGDSYYGVRTYWRPDGDNDQLFSFTNIKLNINHYMLNLLATVNEYVEMWTVSYTSLGVETEIPNTRVRYDYNYPYCRKSNYVVYWINRNGGLEMKLVDGVVKVQANTNQFGYQGYKKDIVAGSSINTNKIAFENALHQVNTVNNYALTFIYGIDNDEIDYMETLFSSPMVWLYDIDYLTYIPVKIKDTTFDFNYYKNNHKVPTYQINFESSSINIRR